MPTWGWRMTERGVIVPGLPRDLWPAAGRRGMFCEAPGQARGVGQARGAAVDVLIEERADA